MKNSGVEWIDEIPEDWEVIKLFWIMIFINGYAFDGTSLSLENTIPVIRIGNIVDGKIDYSSCLLSEEKNELNSFSPQKGDIIIAMSGATTGKIGIATEKKAYINQRVGIIRSEINTLLKYYLQLSAFEKYIELLSAGSAQPNISMKQIQDFKIPLPPKSTQQRIASYLDKKCSKIEETIQNQQQVIDKLKAYKQSLITEAVTGKIKIQNGKVCGKYESYKDSGVEWIGKIPSGWEVGKFGRFAQVKSNLVDPNLYLEYPQIAPDNIGKGSGKLIDWQTVKDSGVISWNHLFFKGQIVYSKIRPTLNKLIIAPFDGLCSADMYPIETNMYKQFFVYMMLSQYFVEQVGLITRDRVKMPKINQNELSGILITVPTKEEQKEISDYLDKKCTAIDTAIEQKQKLIEKLTEYKKSLIYECVTGKKEVINV